MRDKEFIKLFQKIKFRYKQKFKFLKFLEKMIMTGEIKKIF